MFCTKCGSELREKAVFCIKCGEPIKQNEKIDVTHIVNKKKNNRKNYLISGFVATIIIVGIVLAIAIGNRNDSGNEITGLNDQTVNGSMETTQEEIPMIITETINPMDYEWILTRTDTYDGADKFLGCSTYAYSDTNKQIKWEMFNADYSLNTRQEYTYDDLDRIIYNRTWDSEGNLIANSERVYEGKSTQPQEVLNYDADGNVKYSNRYSYHPEYEKTDIVWEYNTAGEEVNYKEFTFDEEGNYTGYRYCYPDGSLYETCKYSYDEAGNMVAKEKFNKDNEKKEYSHYQFENGNEVTYQKWNGDDELQVWNAMEYDHAGNEIVRYYFNSDHELLNVVESTYTPVLDGGAVAVKQVNGEYRYESQIPIKELYLWFGRETVNTVDSEGTVSQVNNTAFPIPVRVTVNETDAYTVEITSAMETLTFQNDLKVTQVKLEVLDEIGNTVTDGQLLPVVYILGEYEEIVEEGENVEEIEKGTMVLSEENITLLEAAAMYFSGNLYQYEGYMSIEQLGNILQEDTYFSFFDIFYRLDKSKDYETYVYFEDENTSKCVLYGALERAKIIYKELFDVDIQVENMAQDEVGKSYDTCILYNSEYNELVRSTSADGWGISAETVNYRYDEESDMYEMVINVWNFEYCEEQYHFYIKKDEDNSFGFVITGAEIK